MPSNEEIKQIKDEALARPIAAVDPAANDGGKKGFSSLAYESLVEKKPMTYYTAEKLVIDLTSPKEVTSSIAERVAQRNCSVTPPVSGFVLKHSSRAKSGSASERLTIMMSGKVNSAPKMAPGPVRSSVMTNSSTEKGKSACKGSCERSTESEVREFPEVCALLKADLLEDIDA
ncbi:hypothetical protein TB2_003380 [Malus domestica]